MNPDLQIGVIVKPHGLRGQVRVRVFSEDDDLLDRVSEVAIGFADGGWRRMALTRVQGGGRGVRILALAGCDSREEAERLRGATVSVPREALAPLAPDEFYLADVLGCQAVLRDGQSVGKVVAVGHNGAQPLLMIQQGQRQVNIPAIPEFIKEFDGSVVVLDLPEGLLQAVSEPVEESP